MKEVWTTEMESDEDKKDTQTLPSHFKRYTAQDRKIVVQQPTRTLQNLGESYDGLENTKKIDLAMEGEEPRLAYIAADLEPEEENMLVTSLK